MTNADVFRSQFGIYGTELWAMPEKEFVNWLNSKCETNKAFPRKVCEMVKCGNYMTGKCPTCGRYISEIESDEYCISCGQVVKWND